MLRSARLPLLLLVLLSFPPAVWSEDRSGGRRMAVTIDDLPAQRIQTQPAERTEALTRGILKALTRRKVPAIGFVNENKLEIDGTVAPRRVALLESWLDAGLELGNHTYSHPSLHRLTLAEFEADVLRGERITKPLSLKRGKPFRFFRHPFLQTGRDLDTKQGLVRFLEEHGYRVAPVTVDNEEWIFGQAYDQAIARKDRQLQRRVAATYLDYMESMVAYYESQSRVLFDREIPQILLIHANSLNGDHLAALLDRIRRRGYRFLDLETVLTDPAYTSPDTFTGGGGITWLHRWALTRGIDRALLRGEPESPEWVKTLAGVED